MGFGTCLGFFSGEIDSQISVFGVARGYDLTMDSGSVLECLHNTFRNYLCSKDRNFLDVEVSMKVKWCRGNKLTRM